jgi:protein phosphatase PTC7
MKTLKNLFQKSISSLNHNINSNFHNHSSPLINIVNKTSFSIIRFYSKKKFSINSNTSQKDNTDISVNNKTFNTTLKYKFNIGSVKIPHFAKRATGGEDALAIYEGMICVADGVGGWNEVGVDPSKYSKELCENIKREFVQYGHRYDYILKKIFIKAAKNTNSQGSATFCMASLDMEKNYLHTLNLGDSGYMIIRDLAYKSVYEKIQSSKEENIKDQSDSIDLKVIFKSDEQQHEFNFPYQVGTHGDPPESSEIRVHDFKENDIIVLGTDGLWDNLYEEQILNVIKPFYQISYKIKDLDYVASLIAEYAEKLSLNPKYRSPFSVKSKGLYLGGKADDITIIVAQIVPNRI